MVREKELHAYSPWRFVFISFLLTGTCCAVTISTTERKKCMRAIVNHDYNYNGLIEIEKEFPLILERIAATEATCNNITSFTSKLITKDLALNTSSRYKAAYDEMSCLYCQVQMGQQVDLQILSSDSTSGTIQSDYCCNPDFAHIRSIRIPEVNSTTALSSINIMYTELLCSMFIQTAVSSCQSIQEVANSSALNEKQSTTSKNYTKYSNKTLSKSNSTPKIQSNETVATINDVKNDIDHNANDEIWENWLSHFRNNIIPISIIWGLLVGTLCVFYAFCRLRVEYIDDDDNGTTGTTKDGDNNNEGISGPALTMYSRTSRILDMNILSLRPSSSVASSSSTCSPSSSDMSVIPEETIIYFKSPCRHLVHVPEDDMEDSNHDLKDIPLGDTNIHDLEQGFDNTMPKSHADSTQHDSNETVADTSSIERDPAIQADEALISTMKGSSHSCSTSSTGTTSSRISSSDESSNSSGRMSSLLDKLGLLLCTIQATNNENAEQEYTLTTVNQGRKFASLVKNDTVNKSAKAFPESTMLSHPNDFDSALKKKENLFVDSKHNTVPIPSRFGLRHESNNSASDEIDLYSDEVDTDNNITMDDAESLHRFRAAKIVDMERPGQGAESDDVAFSTVVSKLFAGRYDHANPDNARVPDATMKKLRNSSQSHTNYSSGEEDEDVWNCLTEMQREQAWSEFTEQSQLHQRSDDYYTSDDDDNFNHSPSEQVKKKFDMNNENISLSVHPTQTSLLDTTVIRQQSVVIQSDGDEAIIQRGLGGMIIM